MMATALRHRRGIHGLLTPEDCYKYANCGMTMKEIGRLYGCTGPNISHAIETSDELKAAWNEGHGDYLVELSAHLKERAFKNDIILMFTLKSQFGFGEEQHKIGKQLEQNNQPTVKIYLPHNGRENITIEGEQSLELIEQDETNDLPSS